MWITTKYYKYFKNIKMSKLTIKQEKAKLLLFKSLKMTKKSLGKMPKMQDLNYTYCNKQRLECDKIMGISYENEE